MSIVKNMETFQEMFRDGKFKTQGERLGTTLYMTEEELREGVAATLQKAALDFLSDKFRGYSKALVKKELEERADHFYNQWVFFAKTFYGLNSIHDQQTGWEMIMGHDLHDSLVDFPERGAHHQ